MRLEFDYRSRQGISGVDHKEIKPLTRKEIAQLRYYLEQAKRNKRKYQFLAVLISLVALALIVFLFLEFVAFLQDSPPGFFRGKDGELWVGAEVFWPWFSLCGTMHAAGLVSNVDTLD